MRNVTVFIIIFLVLLPTIPVNALQKSEISLGVTVLSPYAGLFESPREVTIKVVVIGTSQVFTVGDFVILVGGKSAEVVSLVHEELDFDKHMYIIGMIPPKQKSPGRYDLQVILPVKGVTLKDSITYSGKNVDIVFLIDGSGSMKKNDPRGIRKEGVKLLLSKLDFGDSVAIVEFDSSVHVLFPLSTIWDEVSRERVMEAVEGIGAEGKTNIQEALDMAYECLLNSSTGNNRKAVILLTDGYNTVGSLNETGIIRKFQSMGWPIYTIALTGEADEQLLKKLAEETGGIYMKADNAEDLIPVYNSIKTSVKNEVSLKSESGEIKSGEVKEGEISIGDEIKSFEITVVGEGINLYLYLPDGSMVELDENSPTGTSYENIYYVKSEDYQFYRVLDPQPGLWKYRIVASTGGSYHLSASANAPLSLIPNVKVFPENGTVVISGRVLRNGTVVKTANVDVVLSGTFGKRTLPAGFVEEYSIGGTDFLNSYIVVVHLDSGNYSVRLIARMPDGTVVNSETLNFRVGFEEIYRGEGYIVATDGVSRTYLLNFKREILWSYETGRPRVAHIHNGLVAVGSTRIYMFNITGKPLWDYQFNSSVTAVTIGDEHVAVAVGMKVYLFTLDGRPLWERQLPPENGRVERVYLVEDRTEIRVYVVQEKETTVIDEGGEVVGTIEIPDVRSIVRLVSEAVEEVVDVILDAANTIHVLSGSGEFSIISIPTGEDVTVVLPGEIKIEDEYRDYIVVGTSNGVMIYDLRGNEIGGTSTEDAVIKLVFYGEYLIAGTRNGEIYVLLIRDGTVVKEFQTGSELVDMRVVELEDGAYILAKCLDGIHMFKLEAWEVPTPTSVNISSGLVAYYSFDDVRGNVLPDDSGNGHDGTIHGNPETVEGIAGKAMKFDGLDDWIYFGDSEDLRLSSFTLSFWVRIDPNDGKFANDRVIWLGKGGLGDDCYGDNANYLVYSKDGYLYAGFESEAHSCYGVDNDEFITVPLERFRGWVFVALTYDENSGELSLYLNGTKVKSIKTRSGPELNDQPFTIGMNALSGFYEDKKFKGILDEVRIYNRALSEEEIGQLMKMKPKISYWVRGFVSSGFYLTAVALTPDEDIIGVGWADVFNSDEADIGIIRLNSYGNVKWQKTYGGEHSDEAFAVAIAQNGDIIVAGYTESFGAGGDVWVLRLDENGNVKWQKTYGDSARDEAKAVAIAPNEDILVTTYDYLLFLSPCGQLQRAKEVVGMDIKASPDGTVVFVGRESIARFNVIDGIIPSNCPGAYGWYNVSLECFETHDTNARVESTNAEIHDTDAEIHNTNAEIHDTNLELETLWTHIAVTPGTLEVFSEPLEAEVYVNGIYMMGVTPLILKLEPGTYEIKLVKDGYVGYATTVTLKAGENKSISVNLTLTFGYLSVISNPSRAKVYVDDEYIGETPINNYKLSTGSHKIRVMKDGEDYIKTITISPGQASFLAVNLTPINEVSETPTSTYTPSNNKKVCGPAVFVISTLLALLVRRRKQLR